jgi:hypothetical protein
MTAIISEAERARRAEIIRDSRAALQQGETLEERVTQRPTHGQLGFTNEWTWMAAIDDCVAAAVSEVKATLRKALT